MLEQNDKQEIKNNSPHEIEVPIHFDYLPEPLLVIIPVGCSLVCEGTGYRVI